MKAIKKKRKIDFSAYLFILPVSLFFITFVLVPMLRGLQLSLYSFASVRWFKTLFRFAFQW